jgi:hypothetical protein
VRHEPPAAPPAAPPARGRAGRNRRAAGAIGVGLRRAAGAALAIAVGFCWLAVGRLLLHDALPLTSRSSKRLAEVPA